MTQLADPGAKSPAIVIQNMPPARSWFGTAVTRTVLTISLIANFSLYGIYQMYYPQATEGEVFVEGDRFAEDKIMTVEVSGFIASETVATPIKEIRQAGKDKAVKALVLIVDTPGGTIAGSDQLHHAVTEFQRNEGETPKPVVVWMRGMATSGGYYISAPADHIVAERSCVTGSIGVIASMFNVAPLLDKIGVKPMVVKSGLLKDSGTPYREMTDKERELWQDLILRMYDQFLDVVLEKRDAQVGGREKLKESADGRVLLAAQAKDLGLIDEIGYLSAALDRAKELARLTGPTRVVKFNRPLGGWLNLLTGSASAPERSAEWSARVLLELATPRLLLLPPGFAAPG